VQHGHGERLLHQMEGAAGRAGEPAQCVVQAILTIAWQPVGGRAGPRARLQLRERGRVLRAQEALRRGGAGVVDEDDDGEVAGVRRRPGRDLAQAALEQVAAGRKVKVRQPQHLRGGAAGARALLVHM